MQNILEKTQKMIKSICSHKYPHLKFEYFAKRFLMVIPPAPPPNLCLNTKCSTIGANSYSYTFLSLYIPEHNYQNIQNHIKHYNYCTTTKNHILSFSLYNFYDSYMEIFGSTVKIVWLVVQNVKIGLRAQIVSTWSKKLKQIIIN